MEREIKFEDLPEKMQNDWCEYADDRKDRNIKILSIKFYTIDVIDTTFYKIYYEFTSIVGIATYKIREEIKNYDTEFIILSVDEVTELFTKASYFKEMSK